MTALSTALLELGSGDTLGWCVGKVTATSPFTVQMAGDTVDIISPPRSATYTPVLNDLVFVFRPSGTGFLVAFKYV